MFLYDVVENIGPKYAPTYTNNDFANVGRRTGKGARKKKRAKTKEGEV